MSGDNSGFSSFLSSKDPENIEAKLDRYLHPYNNAVAVRNYMTFEDPHYKRKTIFTDKEIIDEKWSFLTHFILNNEQEQFREVCYNVNKQL